MLGDSLGVKSSLLCCLSLHVSLFTFCPFLFVHTVSINNGQILESLLCTGDGGIAITRCVLPLCIAKGVFPSSMFRAALSNRADTHIHVDECLNSREGEV